MTENNQVSRRTLLTAAAGGAALAASGVTINTASAAAPMLGPTRPNVYRFKLGDYEVTTIFDGAVVFDGPHPIFGQDQTAEAVQQLAEENLLPPTRMEIGFTPVIVNTGSELVMFDAGNGVARRPNAGLLAATLAQAGYSADQVDIVALTHFHPDHIGGLMEDGAPLFPNARYVANSAEFDFWTSEDRVGTGGERVYKLAQTNVQPLAEKMSFVGHEDTVVGGITAMDTSGHTPGHTAFHIESGGQRLLLGGDFCNHYIVSLERPDWHVRFDMDKEKAGATRRRVLDMLATEKIAFAGYHMPFPAVGFVEKKDGGFRYVPATYQFNI
ncbi:MAG: MBL fold metallo-hydrolase [Pseudomonadota bacterium]